jgi:hypothetical protein
MIWCNMLKIFAREGLNVELVELPTCEEMWNQDIDENA